MKVLRFLMKIIAIALLVITLVYSRILPWTYIVAIGVIEVGLLLLVWKRKVIQIFVVILMLITSAGLIYVESAAQRIITYNPNEVNTISFFVLKDSKLKSIQNITKNSASIAASTILDEEIVEYAEEKLKAEDYVKPIQTFEGIEEGLTALYSGDVDVLMIDQGYLSSVQVFDPLFLENTKVIWSIEKSNEIIDLNSDINVTKQPFVVYLTGVDNRVESDGTTFEASRSDTNMLMVVNPIVNTITLVSVPRDAYVPLACIRKKPLDKLTHAGVYGLDCSVSTMSELFDVEVNYYVRAHFDTMTNLVDALGYINVYLEEGFIIEHRIFTEGWNKLNGEYALFAARWRKSFAEGDQHRIKNQQEVLKGIINRLLEPSSLTKIESIIKSVEGTVDTNLTGTDIFALIRKQIQTMSSWTINQSYVTGESMYAPSYAMGGRELYMVDLSETELQAAKDAIQAALNAR